MNTHKQAPQEYRRPYQPIWPACLQCTQHTEPSLQSTHQTQSIHTNQSGLLVCNRLSIVSPHVHSTYQMHCIHSGTTRHQQHVSGITGQIAQVVPNNTMMLAHGSHALQSGRPQQVCQQTSPLFTNCVCRHEAIRVESDSDIRFANPPRTAKCLAQSPEEAALQQ